MAHLIQLMYQQHSTPMFEFVDDKPDRPRFGLSAGIWVDPDRFPHSAKQTDDKGVYDIFSMPGLNAVSQRFKDIVEMFEPDTHQFFPIDLFDRSGSRIERDFFIFNCTASVDTLLVGHSDVEWQTKSGSGKPHIWADPLGKWVLSETAIGGRHVWCGRRIGSRGGVFVSDEFHSVLLQRDIRYFEDKYCSEFGVDWIAEDNVKPIIDWELSKNFSS